MKTGIGLRIAVGVFAFAASLGVGVSAITLAAERPVEHSAVMRERPQPDWAEPSR
jgi:hypothetical protein